MIVFPISLLEFLVFQIGNYGLKKPDLDRGQKDPLSFWPS
jgi:hypothetical protein